MSRPEMIFIKTVLTAINTKFTHSSLALLYLYKYNRNFDITLREFSINDNPYNIYQNLYNLNGSVYCFSCYIWNIEITLKVAETLKKAKPECTIFLGGPEATYNYKHLLENSFIDYVFIGEGEEPFRQLLNGISPEKINGIASKNFINEYNPPLDLSLVPLPYDDKVLTELDNKIIYFETSRGCPFNCSYCLSSAMHNVRYFPMDYVKNGFDLFFKNNIPLVKLIDRTFNSDKKRAVEIIKYVIKNSKNTSVHFEVAPHLLDDELIDLLNSAPKGMFQLEMGIQSINETTLKAINRKTDISKIKENINKISQDVHIHLDLIAGLPFEDFESFKKSFNFTYLLKPNMLQLGFLKVLHGTEISNNKDILHCSYPPYEVISTKWLTAKEVCILKDIDKIVDKIHNSGCFVKTLNKLNKNNPFEMFLTISKKTEIANSTTSKSQLYCQLYEGFGDDILDELTEDFIRYNKDTKLPDFIKLSKTADFKKRCREYFAQNDITDFKNIRIECVNNKVYFMDYTKNEFKDLTDNHIFLLR